MIFALIKNGIIMNCIVADQGFIDLISSQWDYCIRIDEIDPRPGINWTYDGENFNPPE